jgi:hypothetical protein
MNNAALRNTNRLYPLAMMLGVSLCVSHAQADSVSYSADPDTYTDVTNSLRDVFGTSSLSSGVFEETNFGLFQVEGSGLVDVPFVFLFDDGGYEFEFGYFEVTNTLLNMPYDSVAEKEAWAMEALSTAEVIFVDRNADGIPSGSRYDHAQQVSTDGDDPYTSASNDANRDSATNGYNTTNNKVTISMPAGTLISLFIIPNNTLSNFLADGNDGDFSNFALNGSGGAAWPLFTLNEGNPGNQSDGSGEGMDQVFGFEGTTRNIRGDALPRRDNPRFTPFPNENGIVATFEDIWRGSGSSDEDFNDLHFFIGNIKATTVPEASTWLSGVGILLAALLLANRGNWKNCAMRA